MQAEAACDSSKSKIYCGPSRGGGEYGLNWWEGGRLHKKQNGFDDFASCAQYLHSAGFSSPAKLTIQARGHLTAVAQLWHQPSP